MFLKVSGTVLEMTKEGRLLDRKRTFTGGFLSVDVDTVELPNGNTVGLEMIRHPGAAVVVPLTDQGEVLLVRQYRYATGGWLLELPAGKRAPGEDPAECAAREVEEEVGFRAAELIPLGYIWTTPGFTDERLWIYLAKGLEPTEQQLDRDEVLTVEALPFPEVMAMAYSGELTDGKSVCALFRAEHWLTTPR